MILSRHFVFLHIPKTGGSWVRRMFDGFSPWELDVMIRSSYHRSYKEIPVGYQKAPRFTVLRNPWDWYVSMYEFHKQKKIPHAQLPQHTWSQQIRNHQKYCNMPFEHALPHLFEHMPYKWSRETQLPPNAKGVEVLRFENLRDDLTRFLRKTVPNPLQKREPYKIFEAYIEHSARVNTTKREGYQDYYNDHTRKLVGDFESDLIKMMDYKF